MEKEQNVDMSITWMIEKLICNMSNAECDTEKHEKYWFNEGCSTVDRYVLLTSDIQALWPALRLGINQRFGYLSQDLAPLRNIVRAAGPLRNLLPAHVLGPRQRGDSDG